MRLIETAPTFDQYRQMKRFDALDGMRAIGVILVIFEHFGGEHFKSLSGWLGVQIFFVMSGFLITTLLLREQEKNTKVSLRDFYIRRVFRIFPVYYLILAITIIQTHTLGGESWEQLKHAWPYYATFLNEQPFVMAPWKLTWTMGIEWKFYLVWPVILFLLPLSPKRMILPAIATLLILSYLWDNPYVQAVHYIVLLLGAIVAILLHHRITFNILRCLMNPVANTFLFICVGVMQTVVIQSNLTGGYGGAQGVLYYGIIVAAFLPTLMGSGPINKILQSRPFAFVGHRSYSLYLIQILAWQASYGINAAPPIWRHGRSDLLDRAYLCR